MPMLRKYKKRSGLRRRRVYRKRAMYRKKSQLHAPKSFVSTFKLMDVISNRNATHPDGFSRHNLAVTLDEMPIWNAVNKLYGQFAITGVKYEYRPQKTVSTDALSALSIVFAEDKNTSGANTVKVNLSQDNSRELISSRSFKHYVRKPRPELYQQNLVGAPVLTTVKARDIHWLSNDATSATLDHLAAQMNVQNNPTTEEQKLGELWVKVYILAKEQIISGGI